MIALIQRVTEASVSVDGALIASIGPGLLALICAERDDTPVQSDALLSKMLGYRIFSDDAGKMNRSLIDTGGSLLLVPQFTLAADTRSGTRPSFSPAAAPADGKRLFDHFVVQAQGLLATVQTGRFGADMQVASVNNGPVTFWLQVRAEGGQGKRT